MNYHVEVSYDTHSNSRIGLWLLEHKPKYRSVAVMDSSPVGMCFFYYFEVAEDANAFKLIFG